MLCEPNENNVCILCGKPLCHNQRICPSKQPKNVTPTIKIEQPNTSVVGRVSVVRPVERGEGPCDRCDEKDASGLCEPARNVIADRTTCNCQPQEYRIRNLMGMVNCEIAKCPKN